jgi:RNA polymerase sigma factor (sigma-70 family)
MENTIDYNEIVSQNIGLVKNIARQFKPPNTTEYEEYISAGLLGLWKAIQVYDPNRGTKLSTIAWLHIKWEIIRYIKTNSKHNNVSSEVDLPSDIVDNIHDIMPTNLTQEEYDVVKMRLMGRSYTEIDKIYNKTNKKWSNKIYYKAINKIKMAN